MMLWLIAAAALIGVLGLVLLYWRALALTFPEKLSTDEVYLLSTEDLWKIRVCRYRRGRTNGQPVLLVHGANTNQHSFTSPKGANLVEYLVERGYDCWTVDLRGSRSSEAPFERHRNQITTDDFLNYDIPAAIRFIQQETGYAKIHYCGQSLGGMLLYAYVLKFGGDAIASGVTLGSPIGFDGARIPRAPFLAALIRFSPALAGEIARGLIPFALLTRKSPLPFPMNTRNIARGLSTAHFYNMLEDPLPGVLRDLLRWYRTPGWKMDRGALDVQGGLPTIDIPLFTVFAPLDPFVPLNRAQAFFDALASTDKRILIASKELGCKRDYNHCDLAFGMEGPREIFGPIARWFETHTSREQITIIEPSRTSGYQAPLRPSERADILSGGSFARIAVEPVSPVAPMKETEHEAPAVSDVPDEAVLEIEPVAEVVAEAPVAKAPKKKAPAKKPAAKAPAKKAPAKKPAAKAPAKKAPAKAPAQKAPAMIPATPVEVEGDTAKKKSRAPIGARGAAGKSGDLASVSAAITALRPGPAGAAAAPPAKIKVKQAKHHTPPPGKDDPVETPKSVLKALSKASDALGAFKKPESAE